MNRLPKCATLLAVWLVYCGPVAAGGFTETLPEGAFLIDESFSMAWIDSIWDNSGNSAPLIEPIDRYEPGGGRQGVLRADPSARYLILISKIQYGILDDLAVGMGIPVVISTTVQPGLSWEPGDYQRALGRPYSEQDFWDWAESMGQNRPGTWVGNRWTMSDMVLAMRFRFTDRLDGFKELGLSGALSVAGVLPTGKNADEEEIMSVGTTLWDLHMQGDLAMHLSFEKNFAAELDGRLRIGLDLFYEVFFPRELNAPEGDRHPLLLNFSPYVGETYDVKPGDFSGFALDLEVVPWRGPAWGTWLTDGSAEEADNFPPLLSFSLRYTFIHLQQTDWRSDFPLWDWEREKFWRPGYKNILDASLNLSLLRIGVPLQFYVSYRTLNLIPGKNCRAAQVLSLGIRVPLKFW